MNWFVNISDALSHWVIPDTWIIWIQNWDQIYIWNNKGLEHLNVWCETYPWTSFVIEDTKSKCASLTREWECLLSQVNETGELSECPIVAILKNFEKNKKAA